MRIHGKCVWLLGACLMLVSCSVGKVLAVDGDKQSNQTEERQSAESGESRSGLNGLKADMKPSWLIPIYNPRQPRNKLDGSLAGHGIRLSAKAVLAHTVSLQTVIDGIRGSKVDSSSPDIFGFKTGLTFGKNSVPKDFNNLGPRLNVSVKHNIAIYRVVMRNPNYNSRSVDDLAPFSYDERPPLPPALAPQWGQHCHLLVWGRFKKGDNDFTLLEITLKSLNKARDCSDEGDVCVFSTITEEPGTSGHVCGEIGALGAPVMCRQDKETRLSYVITSYETKSNPSVEGCHHDFKVLAMHRWASFALNAAQKIETDIRGNGLPTVG